MNLRSKKLTSIGLAMMLVLLCLPMSARAETVNMTVPFSATINVPCAMGGSGEDVDLSGPLHVQLSIIDNNAGGGHFKVQANAQGIAGVGATSGDQYRGTGVFRLMIAQSGPVDHLD